MSLESRLYQAWRTFTGMRLSAGDVRDLLSQDDVIKTRITNASLSEHGLPESGCADPALWGSCGSVSRLIREASELEDGK